MRSHIRVRALALASTALSSVGLFGEPAETGPDIDTRSAGYDFIVFAGDDPYEGATHHEHLRGGKRIPE